MASSWHGAPVATPTREPRRTRNWHGVEVSRPEDDRPTGGAATAESRLQNLASKAVETGDPNIIESALQLADATKRTGGNILTGALDLLDLPRGVIASGLNQAINVVENVIGTADEDDAVSFKDFLDQAGLPGMDTERIGFGDIVQEARDEEWPGIAAAADLAFGEDVGDWVARVGGFAGDVALDPLSYVTLGATSVGRGAARGATRQLISPRAAMRRIDDAARAGRIPREVAEDAITKLNTRGGMRVSQLPKEVLSEIGVRPGATIGLGRGARVALPGTEGLARFAAERLAPVRAVTARFADNSKIWSGIRNAFTRNPEIQALRKTDPYKAFHLEEAWAKHQDVFQQLSQSARHQLDELHRQLDIPETSVLSDPRVRELVAPAAQVVGRTLDEWVAALKPNQLAELNNNQWAMVASYLDDAAETGAKLELLARLEQAGLAASFDEKAYKAYIREQKSILRQTDAATANRIKATTRRAKSDIEVYRARNAFVPGKSTLGALEARGGALAASERAIVADAAVQAAREDAAIHRIAVDWASDFDSAATATRAPALAEAENIAAYNAIDEEIAKLTTAQATRRLRSASRRAQRSEAKRTAALIEEKQLREEAMRLFEKADREVRPQLRTIARLEAAAFKANADAIRFEDAFEAARSRAFFDEKSWQAALDVAHRGFMDLGAYAPGKWADPEVANALKQLRTTLAPKARGKLVKAYDTVMAPWKAYALLSPGYHSRNAMGAAINNGFRDVQPADYAWMFRQLRRIKRGGLDEADRFIIDSSQFQSSVMANTNVRDMADAFANVELRPKAFRGALNPLSVENVVLTRNRRIAQYVEHTFRGALFKRVYDATGSLDEAAEAVRRLHFDYDDLSVFEREVGRRVIPFYTWTRKNLPLQFQLITHQPGKYTRYLHAKRNIEFGSDPENDRFVPGYYDDALAIRFPIESPSGMPIYIMPDIPMTAAAKYLPTGEGVVPRELLGGLTPALGLPIEALGGEQLFTGIPFNDRLQPVPAAMLPAAAVLYPLGGKFGLPRVERRGGSFFWSDRTEHVVGQTWPLLGRLRRLYPAEEAQQQRAWSSWLSTMFGVSARGVSSSAQYGEIQDRIDKLEQLLSDYESLGGTYTE